ncbi:hypothetical protein [Antrihabitans cavernicola]|uniref:DNA-binding protein n=1 Tax=Antrihabitans cavernicola TaxID=2495913 RepID=A0A5A7S206_9NOCA|nr:hypothetical protein [Spelaeibacter cavernicola]KAA0016760.1 hypothetical protein FOY51_25780 [Spelaeibacter cavernicola]
MVEKVLIPPPNPKGDANVIHYLSKQEVGKLIGLSVNTIKAYDRDGLMPAYDARVGRNNGWLPKTILDWWAQEHPASRKGAHADNRP